MVCAVQILEIQTHVSGADDEEGVHVHTLPRHHEIGHEAAGAVVEVAGLGVGVGVGATVAIVVGGAVVVSNAVSTPVVGTVTVTVPVGGVSVVV